MDKEKVAVVAHKVRAAAIGFIGVIFFGMGTSYFSERLIYRMPRILGPVFDLLGNVGLAVAMLILGGGLIWWGFSRWKAVEGKPSLYWALAALGIAVSVILFNVDLKPRKSSLEMMEEMEREHTEQIEEIRNTERPELNNAEADDYFDKFEELSGRFKENMAKGDQEAIATNEREFEEMKATVADILQNLDDDAKYDFSLYDAKLMIEWADIRDGNTDNQ
jgi:hypothetical protein